MAKDRNGEAQENQNDDEEGKIIAEERHNDAPDSSPASRDRRRRKIKRKDDGGGSGGSEDEKAKKKRRRRHRSPRRGHRRRGRGSAMESDEDGSGSSSSNESYDSDSESEESGSETSGSSSGSEGSDGEASRRRKRRERKRRREKEYERERRRRKKEKERRRRREEEEEERRRKKRKMKKEKKKDSSKKGAVTNSWGKYGIIREVDMWNKRPEFTAWLAEVKKVNLESLANWEEKQMFKEFMEDHNTATFPSKKYYDLDAYHRHQLEKEIKKGKKVQQIERTVFDDEEQRRIELLKAREKRKEEEIEALKRSMQGGMAQAMKEQTRLREEMMYQYKLGNFEAAAAIQRRLDPDVAM